MFNVILARRKTLLIWGGIEAILGGLAWQSYRQPRIARAAQLRALRNSA